MHKISGAALNLSLPSHYSMWAWRFGRNCSACEGQKVAELCRTVAQRFVAGECADVFS